MKFYLIKDAYSRKNISKWNKQLIALEKSFISEKGMYFGSWYKSLYASSDPFSGYAAWILPGLEYEIALKSSARFKEWESRYANAINSLNEKMKRISAELETN
jgi:N-acetylated-alpha-linked acidic dipeptidase